MTASKHARVLAPALPPSTLPLPSSSALVLRGCCSLCVVFCVVVGAAEVDI